MVNNYFANLQGDEARAAVSMMNGVPDTPLSGYSEVVKAVVAFNTFVNCKWSLAIGLRDKKAVLPPRDCVIANNLFVVSGQRILDQPTEPQAFAWQGNLIQMSVPTPKQLGTKVADLRLCLEDDGIWRPAPESPAADAAQGEFPRVTEDIDGQPRPASKDVGCHQVSPDSVRTGPLTPDDVGVSWKIAR